MYQRTFSIVLIRILLAIGLIVLFCHIVAVPNLSSQSIQITFGDQPASAYLQADTRTQDVSLNRSAYSKKFSSYIQRELYLPRCYVNYGRNASLNAVVGTNYVFERHLQKTYLLLDTPPPSYF